jgi:hypothetical protein
LSSAHSVPRTNRELLLPARPNDDKAQNGRSGACPPNARLTTVRRGYPLVRQKAQRMKATGPIQQSKYTKVPFGLQYALPVWLFYSGTSFPSDLYLY